ncbi:hypothetical protein Glove_92g65 [Diversispora epigaea]|uniref:Uncharacterized protein n=1 Tax=Diversispora epigaea TaxID=1348612 RepID=A0A397J568_9GLOM|nr:hypothetical protein Glove_92g65 [Diversispora epigaea]
MLSLYSKILVISCFASYDSTHFFTYNYITIIKMNTKLTFFVLSIVILSIFLSAAATISTAKPSAAVTYSTAKPSSEKPSSAITSTAVNKNYYNYY